MAQIVARMKNDKTPGIGETLALETRAGLPDALRVLVNDYPRDGWESHANFDGLTRFWLERHLMFRQMTARLTAGATALLDRQDDPRHIGGQIGWLGQRLVDELHGHHMIEDQHYFPVLAAQAPALERGFAILDADHHALDRHLADLATDANALLSAISGDADPTDPAGRLQASLQRFDRFLDRHLTDEEELVVPVILKFAPAID